MMSYFRFLLSISRPRFWLYLGGTYLVGYTAGLQSYADFAHLGFVLYFLYFTIVANIFLYGINDYHDQDTDQFNDKKGAQEHLLVTAEKRKLRLTLIVISMVTLALGVFATPTVRILLGLFYFLSFAYSAPPFRFKATPILDFSSNILYGLPGFIGYAQITNQLPSWPIVLAVFCWTSAMHLFSAIPDIESDTRAGLKTSAVLFGNKVSLIVCAALWSVCIALSYSFLGYASLAGLLYPLIPFILLFRPILVSKVYWVFPLVNTLIGFLLFASLLW